VFLKVYFKIKCMSWFLTMRDSNMHGDRIKILIRLFDRPIYIKPM
jgi:hypothetical protein